MSLLYYVRSPELPPKDYGPFMLENVHTMLQEGRITHDWQICYQLPSGVLSHFQPISTSKAEFLSAPSQLIPSMQSSHPQGAGNDTATALEDIPKPTPYTLLEYSTLYATYFLAMALTIVWLRTPNAILFLLSAISVVISIIAHHIIEKRHEIVLTPDQKTLLVQETTRMFQQLNEQQKRERAQNPPRMLRQQWGSLNPAMICPHCQSKGKVRTQKVDRKKGVSGGKATAAVLTGGLSLFVAGLSRKEQMTQAHCDGCNNTWDF